MLITYSLLSLKLSLNLKPNPADNILGRIYDPRLIAFVPNPEIIEPGSFATFTDIKQI